MARYVALTTANARVDDWTIIVVGAEGETRDAVRQRAVRMLAGDLRENPRDMTTQTELENLQIVAKSRSQRHYPQAWRKLRQQREMDAVNEPDVLSHADAGFYIEEGYTDDLGY